MTRRAEPFRVRRTREGAAIRSVWETLSEPWRACVDLAWEAYRADSLPIGAVVADADGRVLAETFREGPAPTSLAVRTEQVATLRDGYLRRHWVDGTAYLDTGSEG